MTDLKEMGKRIQTAIKKVGLKQKFVAKQIGISEDSMGNYITGRREISAENLQRIAELTGVSVQFLLTGTDAVMSEEEIHLAGVIKEQGMSYPSNKANPPSIQFSEQELVEILKLRETNPILYKIIDAMMRRNNQLADLVKKLQKQSGKDMQEE